MTLRVVSFCLLYVIASAVANVEKVIFTAPHAFATETLDASLDDLDLPILSPTNPQVRLRVPVVFSSATNEKGLQSWYSLEGLQSGKRYEVRVCWAATQPTTFWLYTYDLASIGSDGTLLAEVKSHLDGGSKKTAVVKQPLQERATAVRHATTVFLQVFAAADFFTTNKTLMREPPPVLIDLILDPYVFDVFPRSLLPTAGYIVVVAALSWFVANFVWRRLLRLQSRDAKQHSE